MYNASDPLVVRGRWSDANNRTYKRLCSSSGRRSQHTFLAKCGNQCLKSRTIFPIPTPKSGADRDGFYARVSTKTVSKNPISDRRVPLLRIPHSVHLSLTRCLGSRRFGEGIDLSRPQKTMPSRARISALILVRVQLGIVFVTTEEFVTIRTLEHILMRTCSPGWKPCFRDASSRWKRADGSTCRELHLVDRSKRLPCNLNTLDPVDSVGTVLTRIRPNRVKH
jgi:hypothetical protein